ncbi:MAG: MerR family transcriptional regulator [Proteobacteria bacterium]|nr:MerR family transcriptional regulator [Pseudomonadota bacterium]
MSSEYRIGAFAAMAGVSVKTLHFYDQIGLLRPARVDSRTLYRFYLADQLVELAAIIQLKDAGASLTAIRGIGRTQGYKIKSPRVLHNLKKSTEEALEKATRSLACINSLLEQTRLGADPIPVVIKHRRAVAIASVRARVPDYDRISRFEKDLLSSLPETAIGNLRGVLWHRCADSGSPEGEPFVALRQRVPPRGSYELGHLPAATLACAYSTTDNGTAEKTYQALFSWTRARGYRLAGPQSEITHDRVLEIQFPIAAV